MRVIVVCLIFPSLGTTKDVSETLGNSIKNLGNSAIQILEGTGVAAEQALGTGARIVTGVAETAAEAAETGAKSAIRIAHVSTLPSFTSTPFLFTRLSFMSLGCLWSDDI